MIQRIALTGGIACGKSLVAKILADKGIETIDADDIVHEILPDPDERRRIAAEVFADPEKRRALESRLHPLVKKRINEFLSSSKEESIRIAIIPLLFETHWDAEYDIICTVRSDKSLQIARLVEKRGYTREEADARLAAQLPVEEKAAKSHYVINNNGSAEELTKQVVKFIEWLKKQSKGIP
jgi:dephospho-CoA kinase